MCQLPFELIPHSLRSVKSYKKSLSTLYDNVPNISYEITAFLELKLYNSVENLIVFQIIEITTWTDRRDNLRCGLWPKLFLHIKHINRVTGANSEGVAAEK